MMIGCENSAGIPEKDTISVRHRDGFVSVAYSGRKKRDSIGNAGPLADPVLFPKSGSSQKGFGNNGTVEIST